MNHFIAVTLYPELRDYIAALEGEFEKIPPERRDLLTELAIYIQSKKPASLSVNLLFICTHNSRRSHIAQIWAQTAAYLYGAEMVSCFSGGTEATAFNPRAVKAMREAGFKISVDEDGDNPVYAITFSKDAPAVKVFSKVYNNPANPTQSFAAIMTCSHADENCPFIHGAEKRMPITYDDPKDFDDTELEEKKYRERVRQIGREMLFVFKVISTKQKA